MRCCDNCKEKRPALFHLELKNIEPSPFILNEITLDLCKDCADRFGTYVEKGAWREKK